MFFPTNHLVVWCCRDECGGGGDSREENIDRSFHPKSRLRTTFFFFLFYNFFHWTKKTGLQVHPSTTCKFLLSQEKKKKKKPEGGAARRSLTCFCYWVLGDGERHFNATKQAEKNWVSYRYIYIHKDVCWSEGGVYWHLEGAGLECKVDWT